MYKRYTYTTNLHNIACRKAGLKMNKSNHIGTRLRKLRKSNNETQEDLAKALFKSPKTISHYETGTRKPSEDDLKLICEHYGVSSDYFKDPSNLDAREIREIVAVINKNPDAARSFWISAFPIVQNQSGLNDFNFTEGLKLHRAFISKATANVNSLIRTDGLVRILNYYQKAVDKGIDEAKINRASVLICLYAFSTNEQLSLLKEIVNGYEIDDLKRECLIFLLERNQETPNKEKAEIIDPLVMELLLDVTSDRYRDIRDFYLAVRYYWGLARDYELGISQIVCLEMMCTLALVGNEFAAEFFLSFGDLAEIFNPD